jgi:hypothetical protein
MRSSPTICVLLLSLAGFALSGCGGDSVANTGSGGSGHAGKGGAYDFWRDDLSFY